LGGGRELVGDRAESDLERLAVEIGLTPAVQHRLNSSDTDGLTYGAQTERFDIAVCYDDPNFGARFLLQRTPELLGRTIWLGRH
jgi:hypothetical protein